jgi:hypothetical protein
VRIRSFARGLAITGLIAGLGTSASVAVDAASTPSAHPLLAPMKALCNTAVQRRLAVLNADETFVSTSVALTSADQSTLEHQISTDEHGLTALDHTIQGASDGAQAYADCELIVTDYLVYVMEDPKVQEVMAADGVTKVNSTFETVIPELQRLITISAASASIKAQAQNDLNDATSKVNASRGSIAGVTSSVINLVPAGWPGDAATLTSAWQHLTSAGTDLADAHADVDNILTLLGG